MLRFLDWLSVTVELEGVMYTEIYWLYGMQTAGLMSGKLRN
jgi:hypothetical protein